MGVVKAHFETEHDTAEVKLDLVVLCRRCGGVMEFERSVATSKGTKDHFWCQPCHRSRVVRRGEVTL
jgi:hypothetical protein